MTAHLIDGKAVAAALRARLVETIKALPQPPGLAVVIVGDDPASHVYVASKEKAALAAGFRSATHRLPADAPQSALAAIIDRLNDDPATHGILVQLPLPRHIEAASVLDRINPAKDVDGFHPVNVGLLNQGRARLVPCTPLGSMLLLKSAGVTLKGARALVIGRSQIVGRPMAALLLAADCTVTVAHSATRDLPAACREADIVIAALGRPRAVQGDWIKPGAAVIDVGINRMADGKLAGDVDFEAARIHAGCITPVPGGVGPMTIACLLRNTAIAAALQQDATALAQALQAA